MINPALRDEPPLELGLRVTQLVKETLLAKSDPFLLNLAEALVNW